MLRPCSRARLPALLTVAVGCPTQPQEAFDYIRSYTPYDNIKDVPYPNLLVTASLEDYRVSFWWASLAVGLPLPMGFALPLCPLRMDVP